MINKIFCFFGWHGVIGRTKGSTVEVVIVGNGNGILKTPFVYECVHCGKIWDENGNIDDLDS